MNMKRLQIIILAVFVTIPFCAQKHLENDEIIVTIGVNTLMYKNMESDVVVGIHYGHYNPNGIGFRTGSRSRTAKLTSAAYGVARTQGYDGKMHSNMVSYPF